MDSALKKQLKAFALQIRIGILEELTALGFGHAGGSLSIADTLAVLYGDVMRIDPQNPQWEDRDRFVCSKGHAGPAVYASLALRGYFPYEELLTLNKPGTRLPSHTDHNKTPGVDITTGSLGQGFSLAAGMALAQKLRQSDARVFAMVGDGELNEGQNWEAVMFSAAKQLDNLYLFVDWNKKQLDGPTCEILDIGALPPKFSAFGFDTYLVDGNDVEQIYDAVAQAKTVFGKPHVIVLDTVKGKGIADIEQMAANHSITVAKEKGEAWLTQLRAELAALGE